MRIPTPQKIKGPGAIFVVENGRRRSVRVLKLYRGFILKKMKILTPQNFRDTIPLSPWWVFF
jgi:hypothetical protein